MGKRKKSRFFRWLSKHDIVWQVTMIYSVIILVPTIIIGIAFAGTMYNTSLADANRRNANALLQMRRAINANMENAESLSRKVQYDLEPQYYLLYGSKNKMLDIYTNESITWEEKRYSFYHTVDTINDGGSEEEFKQQAYWSIGRGLSPELVNKQVTDLQSIKTSARNTTVQEARLFRYMYLFSDNYLVEEYPDLIYLTSAVSNEPYYQKEILDSDEVTLWGDVRPATILFSGTSDYNVKPNTKRYVLPYYIRILRPTTGEYLGFIEFAMYLENLVGHADYREENHTYLLWGRDGKLYYSSPQSFELGSDELYPQETSGTMETMINGQSSLITYDTIAEAGIKIGVVTPRVDVMRQVLPTVGTLLAALAAGMIIVILLSRRVARNLFKRLTALDSYIGMVREGEFFGDIDVEGQDEIARISGSFKAMTEQLNTMINDVVSKETAQKDAEMRALQAQINPHFLYNTLENLRMQCEMDEYFEISDKLYSLAKLMRYSIQKTGEPSTLGQELKALESYVDLMGMRISRPVVYKNTVEADVLNVKVPKMILQPILENTFAHARYGRMKKLVITVTGYRSGGFVIVKIKDNGSGLTLEKRGEIRASLRNVSSSLKSGSIGLTNVNKRLKTRYGEESGIKIYSDGRGTAVCFVIKVRDVPEVEDLW